MNFPEEKWVKVGDVEVFLDGGGRVGVRGFPAGSRVLVGVLLIVAEDGTAHSMAFGEDMSDIPVPPVAAAIERVVGLVAGRYGHEVGAVQLSAADAAELLGGGKPRKKPTCIGDNLGG